MKKNGRGATRERRQKRGGQKRREIECKIFFFFLLNRLTYTISLGLTINAKITDKLHMVLDLPRLTTCRSRSKSSHNMQYFTEKIHTKNSTRLNACNKWTLQSFYHKIIKAKQRKLYKRKKI